MFREGGFATIVTVMLESVRALLEGVIDYAGLFPPAELTMAIAVANYGDYLAGEHGWMVGRFIVPVSRLSELENVLVSKPQQQRWRLSVLTGSDVDSAMPAVVAFNAHVRDAVIDTIETKADSPDGVQAPLTGFTAYYEIPASIDPVPMLQAIAAAGCRAKIRTGGITPEHFPNCAQLARFIRQCDEHKVAFKATAGLHHPLRGSHALTYESESPLCSMHGFLNVLLAGVLRWSGISDQDMQLLLDDTDPALTFSRKGIGWRTHWVSSQQIQNARERLVAGFGSCSFEEPVNELKAKGLL